MKPIYQTKFGKDKGNCFQACIASLFELSLEQVPDFVNEFKKDKEEWYRKFVEWLQKRGLSSSMIVTNEEDLCGGNYENCYLLVGGINKDGIGHEVIYKNGIVCHDPNPNTLGFVPKDVILIFKMNPKKDY